MRIFLWVAATILAGAIPGRADTFIPVGEFKTEARCFRAEEGGRTVFRVETGTNLPWPGVTLRPAPGRVWDFSAAGKVALDVKNSGTSSVTLHCRVDNEGADGVNHCVNGAVTLEPGQAAPLEVELTRTSGDEMGGQLFGMRGYPAKAGGPETIDPAKVTQILVFVARPRQAHKFEVSGLRTSGSYTTPTAWSSDAPPFFPFVDTFGQYRHKEWPGKLNGAADFAERKAVEEMELAAHPGPEGWDKYGGAGNGPQLEATGFFRTEKRNGKWWLVDPDGRLFFSQGIDCVAEPLITPVAERTNWFVDYPGARAEFAPFVTADHALLGHYAGKNPASFNFSDANLFRKYGPDWRKLDAAFIQRRLRSWGVNTIGNWSRHEVAALRRTPYTDSVGSHGANMIEGSDGYWGKFPDVFDPSFSNSLRQEKEWHKTSAEDPWCLGFFSDNEMSWGDETSIAVAALRSPAGQAAKKEFVADLRVKYGEIAKLDEAWGTNYASWKSLLEGREVSEVTAERAKADLQAFYTKAAERYFRMARDTVKAIAPHQLYLGCRFAWVNDRAAAAAAKYCDVVSYNIYKPGVANFQFKGGADVPLLIGEFHFGALDRGLFHTGLVPAESQAARAAAYKEYVMETLRHPQFVGCHWFEYRDEPLTGRTLDGENYQIGFVDVADTPYPEMTAGAREIGEIMYDRAR